MCSLFNLWFNVGLCLLSSAIRCSKLSDMVWCPVKLQGCDHPCMERWQDEYAKPFRTNSMSWCDGQATSSILAGQFSPQEIDHRITKEGYVCWTFRLVRFHSCFTICKDHPPLQFHHFHRLQHAGTNIRSLRIAEVRTRAGKGARKGYRLGKSWELRRWQGVESVHGREVLPRRLCPMLWRCGMGWASAWWRNEQRATRLGARTQASWRFKNRDLPIWHLADSAQSVRQVVHE